MSHIPRGTDGLTDTHFLKDVGIHLIHVMLYLFIRVSLQNWNNETLDSSDDNARLHVYCVATIVSAITRFCTNLICVDIIVISGELY